MQEGSRVAATEVKRGVAFDGDGSKIICLLWRQKNGGVERRRSWREKEKSSERQARLADLARSKELRKGRERQREHKET